MRTGHFAGVLLTGIALAALAALAAGCDSSTKGHGTAPTPVTAADGANVAACADGQCEIAVPAGTAIPLPRSMAVENLQVTTVTPDRVTVTGHDIGTSGGGTCSGQCNSSGSNGAFTITLGEDSVATENGLSLGVERISDGTAVLKIA
jgi:hypothetical protein